MTPFNDMCLPLLNREARAHASNNKGPRCKEPVTNVEKWFFAFNGFKRMTPPALAAAFGGIIDDNIEFDIEEVAQALAKKVYCNVQFWP